LIFLTVGSQMQFDRLVMAVDRWAAKNADVEVLAQIGGSQYRPMAMRWVELLPPNDYVRAFTNAEVVVAHAGMGTVISAAEHMRPLIVMPRRGDLRETRSDHQIHTARWLSASSANPRNWSVHRVPLRSPKNIGGNCRNSNATIDRDDLLGVRRAPLGICGRGTLKRA
jgi:UDP-N-acetylglucosamine transferase subunit ALG13